MKKLLTILLLMGLLTLINTTDGFGQCQSNMGFENGTFANWTTSTDSNFITPASRIYYKPGISPKVVSYGVTDMFLGTINSPNANAGSYLARVGNRGLRAVADTVYRTYIIDSLSDKLTIYCKGVSELAHNYWGVPTVEAPGFGYEIYVNGQKLDCLKGSFFCGNTDQPPVWQLGTFKDTAGVRRSVEWAEEVLNFACYVGDTVEVRLFTRDCILLGHYAYAYFDVVCGDTSRPVINQIMLNDIIAEDELTLYCQTSTTLYLEPNTEICPIFRSNIEWTPASYVSGSTIADSVLLQGLDSVWIYATATFSNYCQTVDVIDSIYVKVLNADPHDNIPKMPRNFCDCRQDTLDFGTSTVTSVMDQNGNTLTLNNGLLILQPCDNFYEETYWKQPSTKIVTRNSQIGTVGWVSGNIEGAIGVDSILATGRVRYVIDYNPAKAFFVGITNVNSNNNNDIDHAIYYNGGNIRSYYNGSNLSNLGTYTGTVTVDFVTTSNRRVQIWINGTLAYSYSFAQRATFPVFADFSARSNDTNLIRKAYVFGPTKNIKDFTRLLLPVTFRYYITYTDRCGIVMNDTIVVIPGYEAGIESYDSVICGFQPISISVSSPPDGIVDNVVTNSTGNGTFTVTNGSTPGGSSIVTYTPDISDFASNPTTIYLTSQSGRCIDTDTANFIFYENPTADAGPDITTTLDSFIIGGSPSGTCVNCLTFTHMWNQGSALNDSTTANPMAYKNQLTSTEFVLQVRDPNTGCFGMDTAYVYTSLDNDNIYLNTKCLSGNLLEVKWAVIPSIDNHKFGVEHSSDFGQTWQQAGEMLAGKTMENGQAVQYAMTIQKLPQTDALYRWYSSTINNERKSLMLLENANCGSLAKYNVHPNPFTNQIEINIETATLLKSNYTIQVFNQYGQLMIRKDIQSKMEATSGQFTIDGLESFSKGVYYINIQNNENTLYSTMMVKAE
jgi:hypothetical protein